ncbi:MAG: hypothetical protein ACOXZI_06455 [Candidatus Cryptobacteroides sp.]
MSVIYMRDIWHHPKRACLYYGDNYKRFGESSLKRKKTNRNVPVDYLNYKAIPGTMKKEVLVCLRWPFNLSMISLQVPCMHGERFIIQAVLRHYPLTEKTNLQQLWEDPKRKH